MAHKRNILTVLLLSAAPAAASPREHRAPPVDPAGSRHVPGLRADLAHTGHPTEQGNDATFRALCDQDGYPLAGNIALKGDTYQPKEHPAPPPDSEVAKPLLDLRGDLIRAGREKAQMAIARFRPLCDQDGYPLVGNLANKGDMYQPSQFCSDVRKIEKRT